MNRLIALCLALSILGLSGNLLAKEKQGAALIVVKKNGAEIQGELIAVKEDSLLLLSESGVDVSVDVEDMKVITVVKKSKSLIGAGIGWAAGTSCLLIFSYAQDSVECSFPEAVFWSIIYNIPTALIGAGVGAFFGIDKTIQFEGKSETEVKQALDSLRRKARIPDIQ